MASVFFTRIGSPPRRLLGHIGMVAADSDGEDESEEEDESGSGSGTEEEEEEEEEEAVVVPPVVQNVAEVVNLDDTPEDCVKEKEGTKKQSECDSGGTELDLCCTICMEPWSSKGDHQVSCLPCGHVYGLACITKWMQCKRGPSKCPQCNRKFTVKNIIKLYCSRIVVTDGAQEQLLHKLKAENDFLKMENENLKDENEKIKRDKEKEETEAKRRRMDPLGSFKPLFDLAVDGGGVFDLDISRDFLLLTQRNPAMVGENVLKKISLLPPYDSERINLPSGTKVVRDLHLSPCGKLALCASSGKKASILSMDRNNLVVKYELPAPAWSCSWDINNEHHMYTGLQNGMVLLFDMRQTSGPVESMNGLAIQPVHTIHSLRDSSHLHSGGRSILTASAIGPCVWKTGHPGERPLLVPELENQGVCISLAYSPKTDDIVASFRPRAETTNDGVGTQLSSPPGSEQGVKGSHVLIKRVGGNSYHKTRSSPAIVNNVRLTKSTILNLENGSNPLFAFGDESTRGLSLRDLSSLCTVQYLDPNPNAILDIKYSGTPGRGILGCVSKEMLQLYYLSRDPII